jgi:hypothetical protein
MNVTSDVHVHAVRGTRGRVYYSSRTRDRSNTPQEPDHWNSVPTKALKCILALLVICPTVAVIHFRFFYDYVTSTVRLFYDCTDVVIQSITLRVNYDRSLRWFLSSAYIHVYVVQY